jgi:hypothetical protein
MTDGSGREFHVDAEYLLDMLDALPGAVIMGNRFKPAISALYFKAENGDGILLPLRRPKE